MRGVHSAVQPADGDEEHLLPAGVSHYPPCDAGERGLLLRSSDKCKKSKQRVGSININIHSVNININIIVSILILILIVSILILI